MSGDGPILDPDVEVIPGAVRVAIVEVVLEIDETVRIWHIEFHSKYAEVLASGQHGNKIDLYVWAGDHGIKLDESYPRDQATTIVLTLPNDGDWNLVYDPRARYSMRVVAYQLPEGEEN